MPGIVGMGTTFNLPNYLGELYLVGRQDFPFLSAIGGLTGGKETFAKRFAGYVSRASGAAASARCGTTAAAAAPAAATPAPDRNQRRPISTLRSHLFMRFPIARTNNGERPRKSGAAYWTRELPN